MTLCNKIIRRKCIKTEACVTERKILGIQVLGMCSRGQPPRTIHRVSLRITLCLHTWHLTQYACIFTCYGQGSFTDQQMCLPVHFFLFLFAFPGRTPHHRPNGTTSSPYYLWECKRLLMMTSRNVAKPKRLWRDWKGSILFFLRL